MCTHIYVYIYINTHTCICTYKYTRGGDLLEDASVTKVSDFEIALVIEHEVFNAQIAVADTLLVAVGQTIDELRQTGVRCQSTHSMS